MDVSIIVATFGGEEWQALAASRAIPSAQQFGVPVIVVHGDTLAEARNEGVARARTEWVVHLDADDELDAGYLAAMATGTADLRAPAVSFIRRGRETEPFVPRVWNHHHECTAPCIASGQGNYLVVGTAVRARDLVAAGGWREWPVLEDYELWLRMVLAGYTVESIPAAVYRAYWHRDSRNRADSPEFRNDVHRQINAANGLGMPC